MRTWAVSTRYSRDGTEYLFGGSITGVSTQRGGVRVTFSHAAPRVDLVIGADGLHSAVRRLAFTDQPGSVRRPYLPTRHLIRYVSTRTAAAITLPDYPGRQREAVPARAHAPSRRRRRRPPGDGDRVLLDRDSRAGRGQHRRAGGPEGEPDGLGTEVGRDPHRPRRTTSQRSASSKPTRTAVEPGIGQLGTAGRSAISSRYQASIPRAAPGRAPTSRAWTARTSPGPAGPGSRPAAQPCAANSARAAVGDGAAEAAARGGR